MSNNRKQYLCVASLLVLWLGLAGDVSADPGVYRKLLRATGWVVVPQKAGLSVGTCFVVDRERRLAVTCCHVVGDCREVVVYFPSAREGVVEVENAHYLNRTRARVGRVIATDGPCDLALIRLPSLPDGAQALPLATQAPEPGSDVHSIGNSSLGTHGVLWRYTRGEVRLVYNRRAGDGDRARLVRVVETQAPVNRGDSGGPLVNGKGELVGVVASYSARERLVSQNTAVDEVKRFLNREALAELEQEEDVVGRWRLVSGAVKDGRGGEATFNEDGTFTLSGLSDDEWRGRFAYVNGVLWLIRGGAQAVLPVTWSGRDRFAFALKERSFTCDRRPADR